MTRFQGMDEQIIDARCPRCGRFVKVLGVLHEVFTDKIVEVVADCRKDGAVRPVEYVVWP